MILAIGFCLVAFALPVVAAPVAGQETETSEPDEVNTAPSGNGDEAATGPRFIPVPIFITEPAIGNGLGIALGYFHPTKDAGSAADRIPPGITTSTASNVGREHRRPPTITGIAAAYTDKGTWGVGAGHFASWRDDRIRYAGALGYASVEAEFWLLNLPLDVTITGPLLMQDLKFRVGRSDFFVGTKLTYVDSDVEFSVDLDLPGGSVELDLVSGNVQDVGIGLLAEYEGRDNLMTPDSGQYVSVRVDQHLDGTLGDFDYLKLGVEVQSFHEFLDERLVLGLRLKGDAAQGDPPLWGYPWITLRGVPALRYQNEYVGVVATELRWNLFDRWAALVFGGVGATGGDLPRFVDESGVAAWGIGGRYLFRPQDRLWVGVDLARGPEEDVFYIQVGHAW